MMEIYTLSININKQTHCKLLRDKLVTSRHIVRKLLWDNLVTGRHIVTFCGTLL